MKKFSSILVSLVLVIPVFRTEAQNRNIFFKGDISSSNVILVAAGMGITAAINNYTSDFTYDNLMAFNAVYGHMENNPSPESNYVKSENPVTSKWPDYLSLKPKKLFGNFGTGIKLGYQSYNLGFFNWAAYGSLHYRMNYFDLDNLPYGNTARDFNDNFLHRVQVGVGTNVTLGKMTQKGKFRLDANLRYNLPVAYSGDLGKGAGVLNSGFSTVFGVTWGGPALFKKVGMNIGLSFEFTHYNIFKESDIFREPYSTKMMNGYFNFTLRPNNWFR